MATTKKAAGRKAAGKAPKKGAGAGKGAGGAKAAVAPRKAALARRAAPVTLVTGGTGFLGSHLVRRLVEEGVRPLRVMTTSDAPPHWIEELGVETVAGSVTSPEAVARAVRGAAEIYHLAGRVSRLDEDSHEMFSLHVGGTRLVCEAAREAGVRSIVLASTSGTIAVTETGDITPDEDWPPPIELISRWPYYASKLYQERAALENFSGEGRRLVIVNPSLLLGPGDDRLSSTRVVLDFLSRKIMSVPGGGLSFVDARDAALALRAAMHAGRHGERYLLGAANWSFAKFFGRLERVSKVAAPKLRLPSRLALTGARGLGALYRHWKLAPPVEPTEVEMAEHFWYLDSSKAEAELGFAPRDTAETLMDTVEYVRQNFLGAAAFGRAV